MITVSGSILLPKGTVMTELVAPLVDIDQVKPLSFDDRDLFRELHAVLERHGALRRFGVTLLHKHFDISADEVLVETTDRSTRTQTIQPVTKSEVEGLKVIETQWRLDSGSPVVVCKCVVNPSGSHDHRNLT
jgi:hypothetical protein